MEGMVDRNGSITYQVYHIENSYPKPYKIQFLWCQGHSQVVGNEKAHLLAQKSTKKEKAIQSNQSPPSITPNSGSYCCLGPLPSFSLCPDSKQQIRQIYEKH